MFAVQVKHRIGSGWRASDVPGYWDHETHKGWTIIYRGHQEYFLMFDNRCVSAGFNTLQDIVNVADITLKLLNKEGNYTPDYQTTRIEYIAFDSLNKVLGYFLAKDREDALKLVKVRYPHATWFRVSYGNRYVLKGDKYVPA